MCALIMTVATCAKAQEEKEFYGIANRIGVGIGVGTEGIGLDLSTCLTKYCSVRFGLNFMPDFNMKSDVDVNYRNYASSAYAGSLPNEGTLKVKGSLQRTTIDLKADVYPFADASSFFITGGFSFGGSKVVKLKGHSNDYAELVKKGAELGIDIGDYNVPIDENGDVEAGIKVNGFRPYLGLGFGRLVPKNRVGFRVELGVQFHGKCRVYADGYTEAEIKDILDKEADNIDNEAVDDYTDLMDKLTVYPVIKFSLRGRIL